MKPKILLVLLLICSCASLHRKQHGNKNLTIREHKENPVPAPQLKKVYENRVRAVFPGGESALHQFVESQKSKMVCIPDSLRYENDTNVVCCVFLIIDSNGVAKFDGCVSEAPGIEFCRQDLIEIVKNMPLWTPAFRYDGKKSNIVRERDLTEFYVTYPFCKQSKINSK